MSKAVEGFWATLIQMDRRADELLTKCLRAVEPSKPIGREIPFVASVEALFQNLPATYSATLSPSSDAIAGNNIKRATYVNGGSRVYVREMTVTGYRINPTTFLRTTNDADLFPFNFHWNFQTSITERWYCQNKRLLANAGGRPATGNHLSFKEPLIIEPRETLVFECELLAYGMFGGGATSNFPGSAAVNLSLSGYREGV